MLHDVAFMVEIRSEFERVQGVENLGQTRSAWYIFRQKAVWVTSERGDGRAETPRYDVPQVVVDVVVLTLTRMIKYVVTGQAPVTMELRNTLGKNTSNPRCYTRISQLIQFMPPPGTHKS